MSLTKTEPSLTPLQTALGRLDKLNSLLDVAKAMNAVRDLGSLLTLILREAARVVEADRCSLFILDRESNELWSRVAQGTQSEIRFPTTTGIAGAVATTGQVVNIRDAYADERFNRGFDITNHYRTQSILCVPMRDTRGEITGVIQALNSKDGVFDSEDEELLLALGGQASGAVENTLLHEEISRLFEGFVEASVVAIESRDPSTAGHSGRVAALTVCLAQSTENAPGGPFKGLRFSSTEIQEITYASLLHDFGKVGVREAVLIKAEKLYPEQIDALMSRFELARKDRQLQSCLRRLEGIRSGRTLGAVEAEESPRLLQDERELDEFLEFILQCNRPTVLAQGGFERLTGLSQVSFEDSRARSQGLLTPKEVQVLSITRGSLSADERKEIESHVTHTYQFLSKIPWTRTLKRVPEIAYAHHEKLDGKGYPRSVAAEKIPVQSKMMAIADIYDALTASDRPYKKAVPHIQALDILKSESDKGQLDTELFKIFVESDVPGRALKPRP